MRKLGGTAAGDEIVDDYISVLAATGVTGYPYVQAARAGKSCEAGTEPYPLGVRVDNQKLIDMNAYVFCAARSCQAKPPMLARLNAVARSFATLAAPVATTSIRTYSCRPSSCR